MKPLFNKSEFESAKSRDKLPCECYQCKNTFMLTKHDIYAALNPNHHTTGMYCSKTCRGLSTRTQIEITCKQCGKTRFKKPSIIQRTNNNFCSNKCSALHNQNQVQAQTQARKNGARRSKLELYLETQLPIIFSGITFEFNNRSAINSELDIYIPSLKLAFELNGIFHYEPIFGPEKLQQTQNNDQRKFQACTEKGISLCIIDSSFMKNFKKDKADNFLKIVSNIIKDNI
jgi:hypothetical protein